MKYDLTAAVIGTGYMGKKHIEIFKDIVKNLIICSNDIKTGQELSKEYHAKFYESYEEMYNKEKIDLVSICLPTNLHCHAVLEAAKRKINVLCEKPFASSKDESKKMLDAARDNDILLMIAHPLRFSQEYEYLKRIIKDSRFGNLLSINLFRHSKKPDWSVGNWLMDKKISGGVAKDLHIHETDIISGLFGMPQKVFTTGNFTSCKTDYIYNDKMIVSSSASWRTPENFPFTSGYDVSFENASVRLFNDDLTLYIDDREEKPLEKESFSEFFEDDMYVNEIKYFCHCLKNQLTPDICPPEESLVSMITNDAELESMHNGELTEVK